MTGSICRKVLIPTNKSTIYPWPVLEYEKYRETVQTVHLWTQIIGKIRLRQLPWINHSWHVSLFVYPRGLTTGNMPYQGGSFQIELDFTHHVLNIITSGAREETIPLQGQTIAAFYDAVFSALRRLDIHVIIHGRPNEMVDSIPFREDHRPRLYDTTQMQMLHQALVHSEIVFTDFRSAFTGKVSPVHFFWGGFDLTVSRFSGREAPKHPGGFPNMPDEITQEAYSHEECSCGLWFGSEDLPMPVYYAYCYPTPAEFGKQPVQPSEAFYSEQMGEFILPYDAVQKSANPDCTLLDFMRSTYRAAAETGKWDPNLECDLRYLKK